MTDRRRANDSLGVGFLETVKGADLRETDQERLYRDYMRSVYVLFKCSFVYETNNQALLAACERVAGFANRIREHLADAASLELLAIGTYVNRTLIKLDPSTFDQSDYLYAIFSTLNVSAIAAIGDTTAGDWLQVVAELKRCVGPGGKFEEFATLQFPSIRITPTSGQARGDNTLAVTERFRALRAYAVTVIALGEVLETARLGRPVRAARVKRPLQELVTLSKTAGSLLLALAHLKRHKLSLQHHLANTAVFTICAARTLALPSKAVCELALHAALHDLGRAFAVPDDSAVGSVAERRFALHSIRKLVKTGTLGPRMIARVIVAHEIRRWLDRDAEPPGDTPYPYELSIPTRLVAVARSYSMLTTPKLERPCLLPDEALRIIARDAGRRYDAAAVKLLVNALGVFPVGSTVELSDGRVAIVIEAPHEFTGPARPKLKIVRELDGSLVDGSVVDLGGMTGAHLQILRCIDGEDHEINAPAFLLS